MLEAEWPEVAAALPLFVAGPNDRLQTLCDALRNFLNFSGRWDEWLALSEQAEARAVAAGDWPNAGWRAYDAGFTYFLRGQAAEVLRWADRAAAHWQAAAGPARERAVAIRLRGLGHQLAKDYAAAIAAYQEALALCARSTRRAWTWRSASTTSPGPSGLRATPRPPSATTAKPCASRARSTTSDGCRLSPATWPSWRWTGAQWPEAERLAREALALAEKLGRAELVGSDCYRIAEALLRQGRPAEALPFARARWRSGRSCATRIWTRRGRCWRSARRRRGKYSDHEAAKTAKRAKHEEVAAAAPS